MKKIKSVQITINNQINVSFFFWVTVYMLFVFSDTLLVVILDAVTSIFAGFAIFSIIGHLAYTLNTSVDKVAASGAWSRDLITWLALIW